MIEKYVSYQGEKEIIKDQKEFLKAIFDLVIVK